MVFLRLLEKMQLANGFLTISQASGTVDTNCLRRSVPRRLNLSTCSSLLSPYRRRGVLSGVVIIISVPEVTYLPLQTQVLKKKMEVKLWLMSWVCSYIATGCTAAYKTRML